MKKSPHRFFLFMCSCCCCSFSPRRRLHMLKPGSNWIELVCGLGSCKTGYSKPTYSVFLSMEKRAAVQAAVCRATFTEISTAQRPQASKWMHTAHCFCTSAPQQSYALCPLCTSPPSTIALWTIRPIFLSPSCPRHASLSFKSRIACSCSQSVISQFSGKQKTHNENP